MNKLVVIISLVLASFSSFLQAGNEKDPVHPRLIDGRFAFYIGSKPLVLDAKLRSRVPKTYLDAITLFGPAYINSDSGVAVWQWHFNDDKVLSCLYSGDLNSKLKKVELKTVKKAITIKIEN